MLWSLISSAYIGYLYRKLRAEQTPAPSTDVPAGGISGEIDRLIQRLDSIEARLAGPKAGEMAR